LINLHQSRLSQRLTNFQNFYSYENLDNQSQRLKENQSYQKPKTQFPRPSPIMILPKWSSYLACHPDIPALEASREGVITSLEASNQPLTQDEISTRLLSLKSSPSSIILTLNPVDFSITATHHHDSLGLAMNGSLCCVALTGMGPQAHPVILHMNDLFMSTEDTHPTPLYDSLLDTFDKPLDDLTALVPFDGVLSHIAKAVVLPPCLYPLVLERTWSTAQELLHATIKLISTLLPPTPPVEDDDHVMEEITDPDDEEDPPLVQEDPNTAPAPPENPPVTRDWSSLRHFSPILLTLWGFTQPDLRPLLTTSHCSASSMEAQTWTHQQHLLINKQPRETINITSIDDETSTVVSALDKLSDKLSSAKRQYFSNAPEEHEGQQPSSTNTPQPTSQSTNQDEHHTQWNKIDETFRQGILNASSSDETDVPHQPTTRLLHIVQTKSGSTAARLFCRWHPNLDMLIQPGMATNIVKGMLTSAPHPSSINTFGPFFTQPTRAGFQNFTNDEMNELELSTQTLNLSATDIQRLIRCKPYIPTTPNIFISQIENFDAILHDILSEKSQLRELTTKPLIRHYKQHEQLYYQIFQEHEHFGVWLMNRLHFKTQSILHQCYRFDEIQDINFDRFSIYEELDSIDTLNFSADPPRWYLTELTRIEKNNKHHTSPNRKRHHNTSHNDDYTTNNNTRIKVFNEHRDNKVRLQSDEKYSALVHFKNLENCETSAVKHEGDYICNNWHIRGHCIDSCKRKKSHTKLPTEQEKLYRIYVTNLREGLSKFKNSRRGHSRGSSRDRGSDRSGENKN
jgi:hypothetical protein